MLRKVLCPTDLTIDSRDAIAYAIRVAMENGAELIVFHVTSFPTPIIFGSDQRTAGNWRRLASEFTMQRVLTTAEQRVTRFVEATFGADLGRIVWRPEVTVGKVVEEIAAAARREKIDLIVTGRCRKLPLVRLFSPSVQEALLRKASCPVLSLDVRHTSLSDRGWKLPLLREAFQE